MQNLTPPSQLFSVRRFRAPDRDAVLALWKGDIMHSQPNSVTDDTRVHFVEGAIAADNHVWVAEAFGRIIGWVGIMPSSAALTHLRWLCLAPDIAGRHVVATSMA